jgi:hypothetical protein
LASDDSETAETLENRVLDAHATVVVPLADCTEAPAELIETTLPETALKLAANCGPPGPDELDPGADPALDPAPEPPPHAATTSAVNASPAADSARRWMTVRP